MKQLDLWVVLCHWHSCPRYRRNNDGTACSMSHKTFLLLWSSNFSFSFFKTTKPSFSSHLRARTAAFKLRHTSREQGQVHCNLEWITTSSKQQENKLQLHHHKNHAGPLFVSLAHKMRSQPVTVNSCRLSLVCMNKSLHHPHTRGSRQATDTSGQSAEASCS